MSKTVKTIGKALWSPFGWYFRKVAENYEKVYGPDAWKYMRWM